MICDTPPSDERILAIDGHPVSGDKLRAVTHEWEAQGVNFTTPLWEQLARHAVRQMTPFERAELRRRNARALLTEAQDRERARES